MDQKSNPDQSQATAEDSSVSSVECIPDISYYSDIVDSNLQEIIAPLDVIDSVIEKVKSHLITTQATDVGTVVNTTGLNESNADNRIEKNLAKRKLEEIIELSSDSEFEGVTKPNRVVKKKAYQTIYRFDKITSSPL